jgi:hypothetical protein
MALPLSGGSRSGADAPDTGFHCNIGQNPVAQPGTRTTFPEESAKLPGRRQFKCCPLARTDMTRLSRPQDHARALAGSTGIKSASKKGPESKCSPKGVTVPASAAVPDETPGGESLGNQPKRDDGTRIGLNSQNLTTVVD